MRKVIGILPAAGLGSRLKSLHYPKELMPIGFHSVNGGTEIRPYLVIEHSLDAMRYAAVSGCIVVISDRKTDIVRTLGDGNAVEVPLIYAVQANPYGLANAIDCAFAWVGDDTDSCMALPDTIFSPIDAIAQVLAHLRETECDLCLGVFPTETPEELAPVNFRTDGRVYRIVDKPPTGGPKNTWGVAAWSPRFSKFMHEALTTPFANPLILSQYFNDAVAQGFDVRALYFSDGSFSDLGTPRGLAKLLRQSNEFIHSAMHEAAQQ